MAVTEASEDLLSPKKRFFAKNKKVRPKPRSRNTQRRKHASRHRKVKKKNTNLFLSIIIKRKIKKRKSTISIFPKTRDQFSKKKMSSPPPSPPTATTGTTAMEFPAMENTSTTTAGCSASHAGYPLMACRSNVTTTTTPSRWSQIIQCEHIQLEQSFFDA